MKFLTDLKWFLRGYMMYDVCGVMYPRVRVAFQMRKELAAHLQDESGDYCIMGYNIYSGEWEMLCEN